jgi:urea transporter
MTWAITLQAVSQGLSTTNDEVASGTELPVALTDGFQQAFWVGAAVAFVGVLVSLFLVRGRDLRTQEAVIGEPALEGGAA